MPKLASLPENVSQLSSLRELSLDKIGTAYCDLSRGYKTFKKQLFNNDKSQLKFFELPEQIGGLSSLEVFFFLDSGGITKFPKSFGKLKQLKE